MKVIATFILCHLWVFTELQSYANEIKMCPVSSILAVKVRVYVCKVNVK